MDLFTIMGGSFATQMAGSPRVVPRTYAISATGTLLAIAVTMLVILAAYVLVPVLVCTLLQLAYSAPVFAYYQAEDRYVDASAGPTLAMRYDAAYEWLTGAPLTYATTLYQAAVARCTLRVAGLPSYSASRLALLALG